MASNRKIARRYNRWMRYERRVGRLFGRDAPRYPLPHTISPTAARVVRAYERMRIQRWVRQFTGGPW